VIIISGEIVLNSDTLVQGALAALGLLGVGYGGSKGKVKLEELITGLKIIVGRINSTAETVGVVGDIFGNVTPAEFQGLVAETRLRKADGELSEEDYSVIGRKFTDAIKD
jgi:hypothetical protein